MLKELGGGFDLGHGALKVRSEELGVRS